MPNLMTRAEQVFTPGSPINNKDLFSGRLDQIKRALAALNQPGRHPVIYGLRGVGKTSLANLLRMLLQEHSAIRVSCDSSDTFKLIWNRVLKSFPVSYKENALGFAREQAEKTCTLSDFLGKDNGVSPSDIASIFERIKDYRSIIILDEFDRVSDEPTKRAMADLIKNISDNLPLVKLILVGVGSNITELIGQHPSISRNLVEIEVPIMSTDEIIEILRKGCTALQLEVNEPVFLQASLLANGFPHYAHHLGLCIAKACDTKGTSVIDEELFDSLACSFAVEDALEVFRQAYSKATKTTQASRYPQIFCACAHATHDENGVFRSSDVVEAISRVFGESLTLQSVVPALGEFSAPHRGPALIKVPHRNRNHYKFCDPMLIPFLHLKTKQLLAE
jgi:Cdc6-like AAA superfamily ATPase